MIAEGDKAPAFSGVASDGKQVGLADFLGRRPVVLYFYPRDNTPVCTKEACSFRDHAGEIASAGGAVIGVSMDSQESHDRFVKQHNLNFPLLADTDGEICKAYGVARLGGLLGGWIPAKRVTFVIDREGTVRRVIASEFNASKHVDQALETLRELGADASRRA